MSKAKDVIIRPIITEKTMLMTDENNTITFEVNRRSNKTEIKQAVEELFDVKVARVNVINSRPKRARMGQFEGKTKHVKKAMVKLKDGYSIDVFEER